jgi:hypothetical protein
LPALQRSTISTRPTTSGTFTPRPGRCAVSVQLTRVMRGHSRLLTVSEVGCSAAFRFQRRW